MSKTMRIAITGSVIFWIITFFIYLFNIGGETYFPKVADSLAIVPAVFAFIASLFVFLGIGKIRAYRATWAFMSIGLGLYVLAEISWSVYEIVLGIKTPFPSLADFFWLIGYVPFFIALVLKYRSLETTADLWLKLSLAIVLVSVLAVSTIYILIPITLCEKCSSLEKFIYLAYPVLDLFLIAISAMMVLPYGSGMLGRPWLFISSGFIAFGVADLLYSYLSWNEIYANGNMTGLLYALGYILIGLGAISKLDLISNLLGEAKTKELLQHESLQSSTTKSVEHQLV